MAMILPCSASFLRRFCPVVLLLCLLITPYITDAASLLQEEDKNNHPSSLHNYLRQHQSSTGGISSVDKKKKSQDQAARSASPPQYPRPWKCTLPYTDPDSCVAPHKEKCEWCRGDGLPGICATVEQAQQLIDKIPHVHCFGGNSTFAAATKENSDQQKSS